MLGLGPLPGDDVYALMGLTQVAALVIGVLHLRNQHPR